MYALTNCRILTGSDTLNQHAVLIEGNKIKAIVAESELDASIAKHDLEGAYLSAGFIDLQLNGCGGVMFNDEVSADTIHTMHLANLKSGCTSFLPTLITSSDQDMKQSVQAIRDYQAQFANQALGLHLEGPYLNVAKKGIHSVDYIRPSDEAMIDFMAENADVITKVTLAPELTPPAHIEKLAKAGIVVSAGHTNASYAEARLAFQQGVTFTTHSTSMQ